MEMQNLNEPEKDKLGTYEIKVPKVYAPLFTEQEVRKFVLASGRISGKTSILVSLVYTTIEAFPNFDIVIAQATTAEIKNSIINEIREFYVNKGFDVGEKPSNIIQIPKSNDKVIINDGKHKGGIYIFPITDSNGGQRTRGIKLKNPCSLVLFEEVQKNKNRAVVDNAIATLVASKPKASEEITIDDDGTLGIGEVSTDKLVQGECTLVLHGGDSDDTI
jgi:hypothetical protein